jgi:xylan 1,4-beta-xylosidase
VNACARGVAVLLALCASAASATAQTVEGWFDGTYNPTCTFWGWARDATNSAPIQVRVYRGDSASGVLVSTLLADRPRPDLQFPDRNHGFEHTLTAAEINAAGLADGNPHALNIYAVSHGGALVALSGNGKTLQCVSLSSVSVDFGMPVPVNSASGFLLAYPSSDAAIARVRPLQPRFWRFSDAFVNGTHYPFTTVSQTLRAAVPGITLNFLMSDNWGYPDNNWRFGLHTAPWLNWAVYEQFVRTTAQAYRTAGLDAIVEVWNEPDVPMFWNGTREQFFETYLRAYKVLRAELGPDAIIAGPSLGTYDRAAIVAFLEFCLANGCEVNSLIWHALDDGDVPSLPGRVEDARVSLLQNPRYAPLRIQRIDINEIIGPVYTYQPAGTLHHYDVFEKSGAGGAAHACWPDSNGTSGCYNSTIDGLLTVNTLQPRAAWWTHKVYVDGVASRVHTSVQDQQTGSGAVAVASSALAGAPIPQVLIGYVDIGRTWSNTAGRLKVQLEMSHWDAVPLLAGTTTARLVIERIPATGEAMLPRPVFVQQTNVPIVEGRVRVDLPVLNVGEVFRITAVGGLFTDDPLAPGSTTIRAIHVNELRARIDAQRARRGLQPFAWSAPTLTPAVTIIHAQQVVELRNALFEAHVAAGSAPPQWIPPTLTATTTVVRAAHISELRAAVLALEQQ